MYGCRVNREDFPDEERMNEKDSSVERQRKLNGRGWGRWKALKRPSLAMKRGDDASCFLLSVSLPVRCFTPSRVWRFSYFELTNY